MKTNNPRTLMPNLPGEIVNDILLKLPAKSIGRFRCVSKHWCNLLSNDDFIETHLKHDIETENLNCFSIQRNDENAHEFLMHITKSSSLFTVFEKRYCKYVKMGSLFEDTNLEITIVGSDNGLILMTSRKKYCRDTRHWLWNPYHKEFKEILIPEAYGPPDCQSWAGSVTYGVDYNRDTGDYKIVVASCYAYTGICYGCRIQVYTSELNSWRTLPSLLPYMCYKGDVVFLHGAFHWLGRRLGTEVSRIISFDIHGDNFNEVAVTPQVHDTINHYHNHNHTYKVLGVLEGCLCIVRGYGCSHIDVWVKKDYDVTESWTKLFNFRIPKLARRMHKVKILWEFKNGEVLFVTTRNSYGTKNCCLVLYDPLSKQCKVTKILHSAEVIEWNIEAYV